MSALDPIAQREALRERLLDIDSRQLALHERALKAEADLRAAEIELADIRVRELTGDATAADLAKALKARDQAKAAAKDPAITEERDAIERARKLTTRELAALTREHASTFETDALKASEAAEAALQALDAQLREAAALWGTAQAAWSVLEREQDGGGDVATLTPEALRFGSVPAFPLPPASVASAKARPADR
jgi:hypothetical protein